MVKNKKEELTPGQVPRVLEVTKVKDLWKLADSTEISEEPNPERNPSSP